MTLAALPLSSNHSILAYREHVLDLHLSLSSILSNMFLMKMDWLTSRGLPCGGYSQMTRIGHLYGRLVHSWQTLTCLYLRSITVEEVDIILTEVQANLARIINTPTSRYTSCDMRRVRDCVLLAQAGDVLGRLERFYME